jgi:hypothetical protein
MTMRALQALALAALLTLAGVSAAFADGDGGANSLPLPGQTEEVLQGETWA